MRLDNLQSLVAVVLAGSLAMERVVTITKTIGPSIFGEPGVGPGGVFEVLADARPPMNRLGRAWTPEQWRRTKVLALVLGASFGTAWLLSSDPVSCPNKPDFLCRPVE